MKLFLIISCSCLLLLCLGCSPESIERLETILFPTPIPTPIPIPTPVPADQREQFVTWLQNELGATPDLYQQNVLIDTIFVDFYFPQTQTVVLFTEGKQAELCMAGYTVHVMYPRYLTQIFTKTPLQVYESYWVKIFQEALGEQHNE